MTSMPPQMDIFRLAQALAKSGYFQDAKDEAQAVVKVLYGQELGIGPVAAMMGIYIEKGKPALHAGLIASIIKGSARYDYKVLRLDDAGCEIEFFERRGVGLGQFETVGKSSFTKEDAELAQLTQKETYKKFPRNLFFARAISNGAKWYCPDIFSGSVYTPEEMGAEAVEEFPEGDGPEGDQPPARHLHAAPPAAELPEDLANVADDQTEAAAWMELGDDIEAVEANAADIDEAALDSEILYYASEMRRSPRAVDNWIAKHYQPAKRIDDLAGRIDDKIAIRDKFKAELEAMNEQG